MRSVREDLRKVAATGGMLAMLAGCSSAATISAPSGTQHRSAVSTSTVLPATTSGPTTTFTTLPTSLHVGASASLSNSPYEAQLTLERVIEDPPITVTPGGRGFPVTQSTAERFVALEFTVRNTGGTALIDGGQEHETNLTSWVVTSDNHPMNAVAANVSGCQPVAGLQLEPGGSATACSVFQVPTGADVVYASIQMATGIGDSTVNWRIP